MLPASWRGGPAPEAFYAWRPGAPPARPPRPRWPMLLGIALALCAQGALYLGLRHASVATMPAWARDGHRFRPWPTLVSVSVLPPAPPRHAAPNAPAAEPPGPVSPTRVQPTRVPPAPVPPAPGR